MRKSNYKFNREEYMSSMSYKISNKILGIPQWILMTVSIALSIVYGLMITKCSEVIKSVTEGNTNLINVLAVYVVVNIGMAVLSFFSNNALKAWRLNEINKQFLRKYDKVFDSRTQDITAVGPAKIESTVNQIACYKSDIKSQVSGIIEVFVPFGVTMWKVMEQNLIAGFAMLLLMAGTLFLSINGDNLFHFNEKSSQMKGEMRSVSVNNFVVVRMLKYMGAKEYANYRQKRAQDDATPAFLNVSRRFYDAAMAVLYNSPILIALGVAAFANDLGLAIFVAMNEWTIRSMIGYVSSITETKSEIDGLEKVLESLKGDDTDISEKPTMPEKMILKDVEFFYASDKDHRTPFKIPYFEIERGKRYRFSAGSGVGKAEPVTNWIPTVDGFKRMGDLEVGDYVYGRNGFPTKVTHVFDRGELDVYKVTFNDGRHILVSDEHLFGVWTRSGPKVRDVFGKVHSWNYSIIQLKDMMNDYKKEIPNKPGRYEYKYVLPRNGAVRRPLKPVPIDPWVLGCFIGNGCCREKYLTISSGTDEVPNKIAEKLGLIVKRNSQFNYNYIFYTEEGKLIRTRDFFKDVPGIVDHYAHQKYIPREYIDNHLSVRMEILRGLMDTDGSIGHQEGDNRYHVTYSTTSRQLAKDILEILYSIGYSGKESIDKRVDKYTSGYCANIIFRVPNKFKKHLFTVSYKKAIAEEAATVEQIGRNKSIYEWNHGPIVYNIEYIGKMQCRCIRVQNIEHLYLSGHDYITTHNTSYFKFFAGEMEANKSFDVRTFYIHQRSELVYGTVRENLTLGNKWVPDPVLEELIEEVRLGQWFKSLPNGLDTVIGKDIEPSGGEQSRISLLRLFVHLRNYGPTGSHPITDEVIILDEVTSALDKRDVFIKDDELSTEEAVIKVIDKETKGSTMFVISHEDVSSNAFGFKDIVDEQMVIDIDKEGGRTLRKM